MLPLFRRQGSAKQLIDTAILFAKQENALRISLETQSNNHESHRLYEKWGSSETVSFRHFIVFLNNILSELFSCSDKYTQPLPQFQVKPIDQFDVDVTSRLYCLRLQSFF